MKKSIFGVVLLSIVTLRHAVAWNCNTRPHEAEIARRRLLHSIGGIVVSTTSSQIPAFALSPPEASKAYDGYAKTYDNLDGGSASSALGIDEARSKLFHQAHGKVLEIGVGTGLNLLGKYDLAKVSSLTLVDISEGMIQEAKRKAKDLPKNIPISFVRADATSELVDQFGENAFDTVVDSFTLCVLGSEGAKKCLEQVAKVVKPGKAGGQILLLENTRSTNSVLGLYQDLTADAAASTGGKGCVYNQNVGEMIRRTQGLTIDYEEAYVAGLFRSFVCVKNG